MLFVPNKATISFKDYVIGNYLTNFTLNILKEAFDSALLKCL